jgi:hypothetical protein
MPVTQYKPGDLGFDDIAKQIRHISRIRKDLSHSTTYIDAERSPSKMSIKRRNESIEKHRG